MTNLISLAQYACSFLFGAVLSFLLSGAQFRHGFRRKAVGICVTLLLLQLAALFFLGLDLTRKLYPLIVHLPLWILMVRLLKTDAVQSAVSVLIAYMCCQLPRWIASAGLFLPDDHLLYQVLYLVAAPVFLYYLCKYLVPSVRWCMERSRKSCLIFGLVPGIYYIFDYITTVYTSLLLSGNRIAVQFMPSVVALVYLLFLVIYDREAQRQNQLIQERDLMELQLYQTHVAYQSMSHLQEKTRQYRHDMRHHITLLQSMAKDNNLEQIRQYLNIIGQEVAELTPVRLCGNDVVNLLLSYYAGLAQEKNVALSLNVNLPAKISCSDTELCSVLSNGLENAIMAASQLPPSRKKTVDVHIGIRGSNLLIQIENPYTGDISWTDGLPCSQNQEHGIGTRSIRTIVRSHGGETLFQARDGLFQLRILLPLNS